MSAGEEGGTFIVFGLRGEGGKETFIKRGYFVEMETEILRAASNFQMPARLHLSSCAQFSVSLQTEERVQPEYQRRRGTGVVPSVSHVTHARHQESCLHTTRTSFSLPIPLCSTPGFCTAIGENPTTPGERSRLGQEVVGRDP